MHQTDLVKCEFSCPWAINDLLWRRLPGEGLLIIKVALEAAGVEFIGTPEDAPGVRLRHPQQG
jgi:hypothetical protein